MAEANRRWGETATERNDDVANSRLGKTGIGQTVGWDKMAMGRTVGWGKIEMGQTAGGVTWQ